MLVKLNKDWDIVVLAKRIDSKLEDWSIWFDIYRLARKFVSKRVEFGFEVSKLKLVVGCTIRGLATVAVSPVPSTISNHIELSCGKIPEKF